MSELEKAAEEYASRIDSMNQADWEAERAFLAGAAWQREADAVLCETLAGSCAYDASTSKYLAEDIRKSIVARITSPRTEPEKKK
jgi:hypothetical protein